MFLIFVLNSPNYICKTSALLVAELSVTRKTNDFLSNETLNYDAQLYTHKNVNWCKCISLVNLIITPVVCRHTRFSQF